ncbi:MAG: DUF4920 domain-containing protein [Myxococcota bacterium]
MHVRIGLLALSLLALFTACQKKPDAGSSAGAASVAASATAPGRAVQRFGSAISAGAQSAAVGDVLAAPERFQGKPVLVEGYVRRACSRKGCWMELAGGADPNLEGCRVTFKDYGFFVPTDSAGSSARVEAALEVASLSPATVEHMEREGAKIAHKAADGSAREVRLVATGVELWR